MVFDYMYVCVCRYKYKSQGPAGIDFVHCAIRPNNLISVCCDLDWPINKPRSS